jgi:hypothetical protein
MVCSVSAVIHRADQDDHHCAGESGSMASATSSQSNQPQDVKNNVTDTAPPRNTTSTATDYCTAAATQCGLSAINKSHARHGPARPHLSFWDRLGNWAAGAESVISATFGRPIPVLIHDLEYPAWVADLTGNANPPGLAETFTTWVCSR